MHMRPNCTGRGGHHGRAAQANGGHCIGHGVAAGIYHGLARCWRWQKVGGKVRIGPGLATTGHGLAQGGQIIRVDQVGRVLALWVKGAGFRACAKYVMATGAISHGDGAGFFVGRIFNGLKHVSFSLSRLRPGGVLAWLEF
ncbi:hypothetical protein, partial [Limnohabitans sp.]|uniref:hypothetical protein n=1 Tax=Limnohabitans sp. TaxID=1907725 RepID=UPI00333E7C08